ncbi:MAG: glycosyltransferase [Candidatus Parcubacteria bacterium]|nr:glycosyltransferase [Candidatus Parcubacteria bacterium]
MLVEKKKDKIKILTISDMPIVLSGVATQTKYLLEGLLKTGRYQVLSIGAAIKHQQYNPLRIDEYNGDWVILPTDGYGNPQLMREILDVEKPDVIWFMTDPRFFTWLFEMIDEVVDRGIPLLWNTIWDNGPTPTFNKFYYDSCTFLGCISKLTYGIMKDLGLEHKAEYIPHAVPAGTFKILDEKLVQEEKLRLFGKEKKDSFVVFYNSRNARRKKTNDAIAAFKQFADAIGDKPGEKCFFVMNTDPHDPEGSDLLQLCSMLNLDPSQITFLKDRVDFDKLALLYNMADVTICASAEEGFGLSSLESLMCGTNVISTKTGGLQEQNVDPDTGEVFGVSVEPVSKLLVGSQQIPWIYSDHPSHQQFVDAFVKVYGMSKQDRDELGKRAQESVVKRYDLDRMIGQWDKAITKCADDFKNGNPRRIRVRSF